MANKREGTHKWTKQPIWFVVSVCIYHLICDWTKGYESTQFVFRYFKVVPEEKIPLHATWEATKWKCCYGYSKDIPISTGQKLFLRENSEFLILAIFSVLKEEKISNKKGMRRLGRGFKIGLNKNGSKFRETKLNIFFVITTLTLWLT